MEVLLGVLGVVLLVVSIFGRALTRKATIERPDGSTMALGQQGTEQNEPKTPRKRQIGRTTLRFPYIQQRHDTVNSFKQKYGSALRIVHRGRVQERDAWGLHTIYTLVIEVPVKCPACKESFAIDDFGLADCPGCGSPLIVYFDDALGKKVVQRVEPGVSRTERAQTVEPPETRASPAKSPAAPEEGGDAVADRFSKLG